MIYKLYPKYGAIDRFDIRVAIPLCIQLHEFAPYKDENFQKVMGYLLTGDDSTWYREIEDTDPYVLYQASTVDFNLNQMSLSTIFQESSQSLKQKWKNVFILDAKPTTLWFRNTREFSKVISLVIFVLGIMVGIFPLFDRTYFSLIGPISLAALIGFTGWNAHFWFKEIGGGYWSSLQISLVGGIIFIENIIGRNYTKLFELLMMSISLILILVWAIFAGTWLGIYIGQWLGILGAALVLGLGNLFFKLNWSIRRQANPWYHFVMSKHSTTGLVTEVDDSSPTL